MNDPAVLTRASLAILLGTGLGSGTWLLMSLLPRWRALPLVIRIAPYIRDVTDPAGTTLAPPDRATPNRWRGLGSEQHPLNRAVLWVSALVGGHHGVQRRLLQAGRTDSVERFRAVQLLTGLIGVFAGAIVTIALAIAGRGSAGVAALPLVFGFLAAVGPQLKLQRDATLRMRRIQEELPAVLDFLSLCLSAGESIRESLRRVGAIGSGELARELDRVVIDAGTGEPLPQALSALSRRLQLAGFSRAVDQLVAAMERGAPLASVLQAQANDAREDAKRLLIERAGRAEILMLLPHTMVKTYLCRYHLAEDEFTLRLADGCDMALDRRR